MKRPGWLPPRSAPLRPGRPTRRKPVKAVNRKRRQSEFARCYGSKERVAWIKSLYCAVTCCYQFLPVLHDGPIECAHARGDGIGRKGESDTIVPLCRGHHQTLHRAGIATFERGYGVNLLQLAAEYEAAWQSHLRETGRARQETDRANE